MLAPLETYVAVVEEGSLAKAARRLKLSTASITRRINQLEEELGAQLLIRTTRHLVLTDKGQAFYQSSLKILAEFQLAYSTMTESTGLIGKVKLGVPASLYFDYLLPKLPHLLDRHPNLQLEVIQGNHLDHLISQGFDLAIHCGELADSSLYAKKIGGWAKYICASPSYLEKNKKITINQSRALLELNCLDHSDNRHGGWWLQDGQERFLQTINLTHTTNSSLALRQMAIAGLGVIYLPSFTVNSGIKQGKLVRILSTYEPATLPMYAVSLLPWQQQSKLTFLLDWLKEALQEAVIL